ncbi:unnamed protein product, partial [Rotaria socialis]
RRELKELYTGKRIQALLARKLENGVDNSIGQHINDEIPQNDILIGINDKPTVDQD